MITIVSVFADDQLMDQHNEFHSVSTKNPLEHIVGVVVVPLQILKTCYGETNDLQLSVCMH